MNATADFQSNLTSPMVTAYISAVTIPTTHDEAANDTSGTDIEIDKGDSGDNGLIAAYTIVPFILAIILTGLIWIIKKRKRINLTAENSADFSKWANKNVDTDFDNESFPHHYQNEKHRISNASDTYEDVNDTNSICYENETKYTKQSENLYYDYKESQQNGDIAENKFVHGTYNQETHFYQNMTEEAGQDDEREIGNDNFVEKNSNSEYDEEAVYMNESDMTLETDRKNETEVKSKKLYTVEEDTLYDHAKAGSHEWDDRERFRTKMKKIDRNVSENIYMNDTNNNSPDNIAVSNHEINETGTMDGKIPVYLELKPEISDGEADDNLENAEANVDMPNIRDFYDYASSDECIGTDLIKNTKIVLHDSSCKLYSNLNVENTFEEIEEEGDDEKDEGSSTYHEYFILEKEDR